jgi:hypothetical protein
VVPALAPTPIYRLSYLLWKHRVSVYQYIGSFDVASRTSANPEPVRQIISHFLWLFLAEKYAGGGGGGGALGAEDMLQARVVTKFHNTKFQ